MAGLGSNYWVSPEDAFAAFEADRVFKPDMSKEKRQQLYQSWPKTAQHGMDWLRETEQN